MRGLNMEQGRLRMAPYVRNVVHLRYSPENPPPLEPPIELRLAVSAGVWRVAARWWRDHQADEGGRVGRTCFRLHPCSGLISADGILDTFCRCTAARGRALAIHPNNRTV
jgi:hypothetical protein